MKDPGFLDSFGLSGATVPETLHHKRHMKPKQMETVTPGGIILVDSRPPKPPEPVSDEPLKCAGCGKSSGEPGPIMLLGWRHGTMHVSKPCCGHNFIVCDECERTVHACPTCGRDEFYT